VFTPEEASTWTTKDVLVQIKAYLPSGWGFEYTHDLPSGWYSAYLRDGEPDSPKPWSGEHLDPKILFLDALGWLAVRGQKVKHPVWSRKGEVPLYHPTPIPVVSTAPDPADLDPDEVEAVYKTSR